jgi:phage baseplate assembly protein W
MAGRQAAFLGRGTAFPVRLDRNTGGLKVSDGYYDSFSVAVAYVNESWLLQNQTVEETTNHVAEAVYNILFTSLREFEEIPWYGSKVKYSVFEPNSAEFKLIFAAYLSWATDRFEKRARFPENGVQWYSTGIAIDRGELPLVASIEYITQQHPKNLVTPFVPIRQVRTQEYPASVIDTNGHDLVSRYYKQSASYNNGNKYLRLRKNIDLLPFPDDLFHKVKPLETWMLIAYDELGDVRYWEYPYLCYIQDKAKEGGTRDILNPNLEIEPGTLLRMPSKERILLINSRR